MKQKPIKAWAVVEVGKRLIPEITYRDKATAIYVTKELTNHFSKPHIAIPVLITPITKGQKGRVRPKPQSRTDRP